MKIDDQLKEFENNKDRNWQRLIYVLRRHLDLWSPKHVKPQWGQMKVSYWPVICNISAKGSTAMDIARESMVVKQSVSRTIKELEEKGMIMSKTSKDDKRIEYLYLTPSGKQLIADANNQVFSLMETYKDLVGEKNLETTIDVLNKIIKYHEGLMTQDDTLEE
ncbi:MarR family winged helix-turn-helix transcriptional regulator [Ohtaekwangia koreensis]|uniref:DNA-binding transcriptional regulator, MarR family n=1 Tax=Ohtaekwangia koreensis TaxID=688867 RepID=A0A1T5J2P9_9BACT|nr:MarR family transcriptional regulator [Ohtaekwangia koreensis]SKC45552.1 DNA-binding transcriptional regulator, MarR family [Ohtaekwangia koreensis]